MRYGYLDEQGCLQCKEITDQEEFYTDKEGGRQRRVIPAEDFAKILAAEGWKPVNEIDGSKLLSDDDDYIVRVTPYDAGECIDFNYDKQFDRKKYIKEIQRLKDELAGSDYKVTKCYEASLMGEEPPYDIAALRQERQRARELINHYEALLQ